MGFINDMKIMKKQLLGEGKFYGYKSIACNRLFLIFCFLGYYMFTDKISKFTKYCWGVYVYLGTGIMISSTSYYVCVSDLTQNLSMTMYMLFVLLVGLGNSIILPIIIYYFSENFFTALTDLDEIIDDNYEKKILSGDYSDYDRQKMKTVNISTIIYVIACYILYYYISTIDVVLFPSVSKFQDVRYQMLPSPHAEKFDNLKIFFVYNFYISCAAIGIATQIWFNNWLFEYLAIIIHNETIILSKYMRYISDLFGEEMERLSIIPVDKDWLKNVQHTHKFIFDEFLNRFINCIQRYQALIKCFFTVRPYFQIISTAMILSLFYMQLANAFMLLSDNPPVVILREVGAVGLTIRSFYSLCMLGQTLENLNEMITIEVFAIPWYCLPINDRKTVLNFMCQVQYLLKCNVFAIIPMNHVTFVGFNRLIYSYTNILRHMQMKN